MFQTKDHKVINCDFVIICCDCKPQQINFTTNSIKNNYPNSHIICMNKEGENVLSLINQGMEKTTGWSFVVRAGSKILSRLDYRFAYFIEDEKDILFPITRQKMTFMDHFNFLIHKNAFMDIGKLPNSKFTEEGKLIWYIKGVYQGYKFKGISGIKF